MKLKLTIQLFKDANGKYYYLLTKIQNICFKNIGFFLQTFVFNLFLICVMIFEKKKYGGWINIELALFLKCLLDY